MKTFALLHNINLDLYPKDFTFSINSHDFDCPMFVAEVLSHRVSELRRLDPTANCLSLSYPFLANTTLSRFASFFDRLEFPVPTSLDDPIVTLLSVLGNRGVFDGEWAQDLTVDNVTRIYELKMLNGTDCEREIEFMAANFDSVKGKLKDDAVDSVLTSPSLKVTTEDSLLDFVWERIETDPSHSSLLVHVRYEFLSAESRSRYVSIVDGAFSEYPGLVSSLWFRHRDLLLKSVPLILDDVNRYVHKPTLELCSSSGLGNGVIGYLRGRYGADSVEITAAHTGSSRFTVGYSGRSPSCAAEYDSDLGWYDANTTPSWLMFDLKDRRAAITSYIIKFGLLSQTNPKRWALTGSNDLENWTMIDDRSTESSRRGDYETVTYRCTGDTQTKFRYVRIEYRDQFWGSFYYMGFASLDLFGSLT
jgi:hypothetical protein